MGTPISSIGAIDSLANQVDSTNASSRVVSAIQSAAHKTGVDFSYLMQKASQESSFDPSAKATTSSATGLFQFTSQTWLHMIKDYGDQYGLSEYASQIKQEASGKLSVADPVARHAILALRKDPQISAEMAGELDKENAAILRKKVGGNIGSTELYLAHFLGASGASNFIRQMRSNPTAVAADVLPTAASSNPSVFYNKSGEARSLQQIYQHFAQKFDATSSGTAFASIKKSPINQAVADTRSISNSAIAVNMAKLGSSANSSYQSPVSSGYVAALQSSAPSSASSGTTSLASLDSSTMFSAMLIGQIKGYGMMPISPESENYETKRKVASYTALS